MPFKDILPKDLPNMGGWVKLPVFAIRAVFPIWELVPCVFKVLVATLESRKQFSDSRTSITQLANAFHLDPQALEAKLLSHQHVAVHPRAKTGMRQCDGLGKRRTASGAQSGDC